MRVVCDANVLVSGILFQGPPRLIVGLASRGRIATFTSPALLREAEDVLLRPKFGLTPDQVAGILALFRETFGVVHPSPRVRVVAADPSDDRVLEAALAARADCIVSGDRHLLKLGRWEGVRIVAPAYFLSQFAPVAK